MLNKINSNKYFDEMQLQIRNKVGNQCFFILFYLLLFDMLLGEHGVQWAGSPMSKFVIMMLTMVYYLVRIVWAGAYASAFTQRKENVYPLVGLLSAMVITAGLLLIIIKTNFFKESFSISPGGILRLFIFYFVFIMIIVVSNKISKRRNDKGDD